MKYVASIASGILATATLLAAYFLIVTGISGFAFAIRQFSEFWYYLSALAIGFGIQISLFSYLRRIIKERASKKVLAVTGSTSTIAMISCCAHYIANIVPVLGIAGAVSLIGQYQIELFWIGIAFNLFGIIYIARKIYMFRNAAV